MSGTQLSTDDPPHSGEPHYEFGLPMGRKQSPLPFVLPRGFEDYIPDIFSGHSSSHLPLPATHCDYSLNEHHAFGDPYATSNFIPLYDARRDLQQAAEVRLPSPELTYTSTSVSWNEPTTHTHFMANTVPSSSSHASYDNSASVVPQLSASYPRSSWRSTEVQAVPQPPPSWTMLGSLDPATGVFQRSPEHPRVRTQQACEKCRIRKAKCSGENPCTRCRTRGLKCEYAAERKMRGPNKVKRKSSTSADAASDRRSSVVSTGSTSSESTFNMSPKSLFTLAPHRSTFEGYDGISPAAKSSSSLPEGKSSQYPSSPSPFVSSVRLSPNLSRLQNSRPPSIDLSRTGLYGIQDQFANITATSSSVEYQYNHEELSSSFAERRSSLPSYLLESYSRVAQASATASSGSLSETTFQGIDSGFIESSVRGHQNYPVSNSSSESMSIHSRPCSNASSVLSTPITPITLTHHFHEEDNLMFSPEYSPVNSQYIHTLRDSESTRYEEQNVLGEDQWSLMDTETPTAGPTGKEKNLAQFESQMLNAS